MKRQYVKDLQPGIPVDDIFFLTRRDIKERRDGAPFLTFDLMDKTGNVAGIMWDRVEDAMSCVEPGGFYHVQGKLGNYQGRPQLTVNAIYPADLKEVDRDDFLRATKHDREAMMIELRGFIERVESKHLRVLLDAFFDDGSFVEQFVMAPAAVQVHHAYLGGLLEHTVLMARLADRIPEVYSEVDRDLLMAGILLHDVGKTAEYEYESVLDHTYDGRLLGHIVIGYEMTRDRIRRIADFPDELARMVLHIILSHHGQMEFGSPKTPKFVEALIVHFLDNMDARVAMFRETIERNPGAKWTDYHQFLETNIYVRDKPD